LDPVTTEASRKAIGAAIEVHKALGPGYPRDVYAAAVRLELDALGVTYKLNQTLPVFYKEKQVGSVLVSMLVEGRFVLDLVARPGDVTTDERMAVRSQLKAANLDLGLIINFAERRLKDGLVRVVNVEKITREKGISFDHDDGHDSHDLDGR
jgi:GxxExxY protein